MICADTNVVSEFMRRSPAPSVVEWARSLGPDELGFSVITVQEIEYGIARLDEGRRRSHLADEWARLSNSFARSILPFDLGAAKSCADIYSEAERRGRPMSLGDAQIAGICVSKGLELATRNVAHFSGVDGLRVVNPFET